MGITLHFIIFDIINSTETRLSLIELHEIDSTFCFKEPKTFDDIHSPKKAKEYVKQGTSL